MATWAKPAKLNIELAPAGKSAPEGDFIGVFQIAAHWQARRQPRHRQPHRFEHARQIRSGGFTFQVWIGGDNYFVYFAAGQAREQLPHPQVIWPHALDRADCPTQHVIAAAELTRALDCDHVFGLFHHANDFFCAFGIGADPALFTFGNVPANFTKSHPPLDLVERFREPRYVLRLGLQNEKSDALSAFGPDSRQPTELVT